MDVITDAAGVIRHSLSFDAWGARRNGENWTAQDISQIIASLSLTGFTQPITTRGYTGHEMVDDMGIIHMNGRIYDPKIARFLQADPFVDGVTNTQGFNRYSYLGNNSLNATDPTGFLKLSFKNILKIVAVVALTIVTYGAATGYLMTTAAFGCSAGGAMAAAAISGAAAGFVGGAAMAAMNGANFRDSMRAGGKGALAGGITGGVAGYFGNTYSGARVLADGVGNGLAAEATGGEFADGFKMGLFVSLATYTTVKLRDRELAHSRLKNGQVGDSPGIRGRPGKLAGGRLSDTKWDKFGQPIIDRGGSYDEALNNYWTNVEPSHLGGHQGASGTSFGIGYKPGDIFDFINESYAGPHDALNHAYHYHDVGMYAGMVKNRTGFAYYVGEVMNYSNVLVATPLAVPSMIPDYSRWILYGRRYEAKKI